MSSRSVNSRILIPRARAMGQHPRSMRGQIFTIDFIISISIFMVLLAIAYSMWMTNSSREESTLEQMQAERAVSRVLSSITISSGEPPNWAANFTDPSDSGLKGIGCASSHYVLDRARLDRLFTYFSPSYETDARRKLGFGQFIGDAGVYYANSTAAYVFGSAPGTDSIMLASGSKRATLGNETVYVRARVWRKLVP